MKKRLIILFVSVFFCLLSCFCLTSCSSRFDLEKTSKNITCYQIEGGFDDEINSIYAVESVKFVNCTGKEINELRFHLYPNAYKEGVENKPIATSKAGKAYPNGYDYGEIRVEYARENGVDIPFEIGGVEENILILPLSESVKDGQSRTVEIGFCTDIANVIHRLGYGDNTVNLNDWFPILCKYDAEKGWLQDVYCSTGDPFVAEIANFDVALTVSEEYVMAVGGDLISSERLEEGDSIRHRYQAKCVRTFSTIMSKKFQVAESQVDGIPVKYYYFDDENAQDSLDLATKALEFYKDSFGKYPYSTLAVVQSDFCEGGMEYPRLAMVTYGLDYDLYKQAIAHEIAHQWWCCLVGNDQIREAWIDEGLAEYSTNLFFEFNDFGIDAKAEMRLAKQRLYDFLEITKNYFKQVDTSLTRSIYEYRNETEYAYLNYTKSMIMFDDLRQMMGDKKFFKALQRFYTENAFTVANKQNLTDSFTVVYGGDTKALFDAYIEGREKIIAP